ncbi:unnamed protein product, partial [Rotaria sp. Silwood1]
MTYILNHQFNIIYRKVNLLHLSISDKTSKKVRIVRKRAQIQTNKLQCQRLSLRIDQLIDPLERLEHASLIF